MPWNSEIYNKFKDIRFQPFYDLIGFIQPAAHMKVVDLGCGTGEQTAILAQRFPGADLLGVDASAEMLEKSEGLAGNRLKFRRGNMEAVAAAPETWDLVFSNAALQWSDDHEVLFPALIKRLNPAGQFAVQMPVQDANTLNQLLCALTQESTFRKFLKGWSRSSPVLSMDAYTRILFDAGLQNLQVIQKVYPIIAADHETLFNFIAGSALIPYLERLDPDQKALFVAAYRERIRQAFPKLPAVYAFKRLLIYGRKSDVC
ncbi:MAG TPA: methyltransferase domain-containing protein [Pedobacter sp.]|nr:methyltransferase domain-containing protein [Pedobacter sp.]